jgi:hypothetical protein
MNPAWTSSLASSRSKRFNERPRFTVLHRKEGRASEMSTICDHSWEEQYANFKETKYQCTICGATQTVPRILEKHTHDPIDDPDT